MNKTIKTIGWILVALGLLGTLADAGALVFVRQLAADRQAAVEGFRSSYDKSKMPVPGSTCITEDKDGDGKPDGDCLQRPDRREGFFPGAGNRPSSNGLSVRRGGFIHGRAAGFMGLPIFLFALGPVMAVIGTVILLVNREPKPKKDAAKEEKPAKTKKAK